MGMGKFELETLGIWPFIVEVSASDLLGQKGSGVQVLIMSWSLVIPSVCVCVWGVR